MAEKAAVTVGTVNALVPCYIRQIPNYGMHTIVLLLHVIQMCCVFIEAVTSEDALHE